VDSATGGFGAKVQQILFVPPGELADTDKTRVALRYGSHAVEISPRGHAFVPHLGSNKIYMYALERDTGFLVVLSQNESPREGDGPRHVVVSPDGKLLYSIAEHTNFVDIYSINDMDVTHHASRSLLPARLRGEPHMFRGDTLRLSPPTEASPNPTHLFATTRGATRGETRGWLTAFQLGNDGLFVSRDDDEDTGVVRWETPTSGGRANAIELRPKDKGDGLWIVLTDDDDHASGPAVRVLDWSAENGISQAAEWPRHGEREVKVEGASHAIWLD